MRTLEQTIGQIRQVLLHPFDSEIQIHLVIIGSDIAVSDGPILAITVPVFGLEFVVGKAQRQPPPNICLSSQAARAQPRIIRAREWMVPFIYENILSVGTAGIGV